MKLRKPRRIDAASGAAHGGAAGLTMPDRRLRYRLRRDVYSNMSDAANSETTAQAVPAAGGAAESAELVALRAEVEQLKDQYLRARSDHDNYRKRVAREREEQRKYANEELIKGLLETVDNLERAIQGAEQTRDVAALHQGVELVHQQFVGCLKRQGVEIIDAQPHTRFDPACHEAVMAEANPAFENDTIIECLQTGYALNSRVLRAAMVKVAKN